ncbi:MAG TPA: citramalate synthase [Clostridiales bacterium]|nr:citramalate synthase [Clostridiales bacterium]
MKKITYLDSTLRDGAQGEGISFSTQDKLNIVKLLDELQIDYIEAGNPFSNPKDMEFFEKLSKVKLKHSKIAAFGSTRRKNIKAEDDANLKALVYCGVETVVIFGKSWDLHVTDVLNTTYEENLNMIYDTIRFLKQNGKNVIYDAEHFFDGYKSNSDYALKTLETAYNSGADAICLCDTNGGSLPSEIAEIVEEVIKELPDVKIGIHAHNDMEMAVSNSISAVQHGATLVQGTLLGIGERCGNANLLAIIPTLQFKLGYKGIPEKILETFTTFAIKSAEIMNITMPNGMAYVGKSAFAHKGGMHIDGVTKVSSSFEHINPEKVGNNRRFLTSEVAGRSTLIKSIQKVDKNIKRADAITDEVIKLIKEKEHKGYQYEGADASLELLIRKKLGLYKSYFELVTFRTITEQHTKAGYFPATAILRIKVGDKIELSVGDGQGPVDALDKALRKALEKFYPNLKTFKLTDYKVRILDSEKGSSATTRVIIESRDENNIFTTVGVSYDIIEASFKALVDAIEYKLLLDEKKQNNNI